MGLIMNEVIFLVEHAAEGGFSARALGEAIFTSGETTEELHANVRDAVLCHFDDGRMPKIIPSPQSLTTSP
jgi:predicted RNase H-like HicB family nuclease